MRVSDEVSGLIRASPPAARLAPTISVGVLRVVVIKQVITTLFPLRCLPSLLSTEDIVIFIPRQLLQGTTVNK